MAEVDEEEGAQPSPQTKKVPKKKHYPFGTPSHLHHPYSEFSHLKDTDKSFAINLAQSTDIEPEIIQEEKPKRYRKPASLPKAVIPVIDDDDEEFPDSDGAPCTRPACQNVIKSIIEIQYKNHIEKLEIEDEYHRLLEELAQAEQQVLSAEHRLEKLNEVGNQLELKLGQLMQKVEALEKNKENLQNERSDINNKIMVSETESHKISRKLERAQKALADAMWRKKKQDHLENVEAGLSLASSIISEQPIRQTDAKAIAAALELHNTGYNKLAKVNVVDYCERQPGVKTLPAFLQEQLIYEPEAFDKYSKAFYRTATTRQLTSRHGQDELELDKLDDRVVGRFKDCGINGASFFFDPMNSGVKGGLGDRTRPSSRPDVVTCRRTPQSVLFDNSIAGRRARSEPLLLLPHLRLSDRSGLRTDSLGSTFGKGKLAKKSSTRVGSQSLLQFSSNDFDGAGLAARGSISSWTNGSGPEVGAGLGGLGLSNSLSTANPSHLQAASPLLHQPQLDPVFFKEGARASWGRQAPLGKVRVGEGSLNTVSSGTAEQLAREREREGERDKEKGKSKADLRMFQQVAAFNKSKLLTTRHPGMDTFNDSVTISGNISLS